MAQGALVTDGRHNFAHIPVLGIEGASIATLMGYIVADIVCAIVLIKMKLMVLEKKFIVSVLLMALFLIVWRIFILENTILCLIMATCFTVAWLFLYRADIIRFVEMIRNRGKKMSKGYFHIKAKMRSYV